MRVSSGFSLCVSLWLTPGCGVGSPRGSLASGCQCRAEAFLDFFVFEKVNVLRRMSVFSSFLVAFDIHRTAEAEALEATAAAFRGSGDKAWNWKRWCKMVQMCWMQMAESCILPLKADFWIVVLLWIEMSCNDWRWCQYWHIVLSHIIYHHYCHLIMPATPATGPLPRAMPLPCTLATGHRTRWHIISYHIILIYVLYMYPIHNIYLHTPYILYINTLQIS